MQGVLIPIARIAGYIHLCVMNAKRTLHWIITISAYVKLQSVKSASIKDNNAFDVKRGMV